MGSERGDAVLIPERGRGENGNVTRIAHERTAIPRFSGGIRRVRRCSRCSNSIKTVAPFAKSTSRYLAGRPHETTRLFPPGEPASSPRRGNELIRVRPSPRT
jgi:hypothetical protein